MDAPQVTRVVTISDQTGYAKTTRTSHFGNYSFDEVEVGLSYTLAATSKGTISRRVFSRSAKIRRVSIC